MHIMANKKPTNNKMVSADTVESNDSKLTRRQLFPTMAGMAIGGAALMSLSGCSSENTTRVGAEDRVDIIDLFARYAWSYDCQDIDGCLSTFTPDGVFEAFNKERVVGHDELREHFEFLYREFRKETVWWHLNDHHVFEGHGENKCRVYSYWLLAQDESITEGLHIRSTGYYITDCVKEDDQWLIAKRNVQRWNPNQVPWKSESKV